MILFKNNTEVTDEVAFTAALQMIEGGEYGKSTMVIQGTYVSCEYNEAQADSDVDQLILEKL